MTITRHRHLVIAHSKKAGILRQGLLHDLSKYAPSEFLVGARYYTGDKSPNEKQRLLFGYSSAWLHHQGRNKHHFEYWADYDPDTHEYKPVKMPMKYVAEMFCDRLAASKVYQGDNYTDSHPLEYFMRGKTKIPIHPETAELLEGLLRLLAEKGESVAFEQIKRMLKE